MNPVWHFLNGVPQIGSLTVTSSAISFTGQALGGDGTASAPTYSFASEPGLGWYRIGASAMAMAGTTGARFYFGGGSNATVFSQGSLGTVVWSSTTGASGTPDLILGREAAAVLQIGEDAAGTTAQMFKGPDRITSDGVGGNLTIAGGRNRGASAGGSLIFQTSPAAGAGVTGTLANRLILDSTGTALFTGAVSVFRTESAASTDANTTYTPAQVLGGIITRSNMGSNRVDAFPTAADLVAAIPGCVVGTSFDLVINNNDTAQTVTVNGASNGITYEGAATAIAATECRFFRVLITNVTGAAEAATVFQVV